MSKISYREIEGKSMGFWALLGVLGLMVLAGLGASWYMEHNGHVVTGMNNQIVWGIPHVFAVFLIVAASGALNVASIASVFGRKLYKPIAPLSALLSLTLMMGGLMVLVLDLGRPDRIIIAMTKLNPMSIFAWNQLFYNGFFVIVGVYLWMMMDKRMSRFTKPLGYAAFIWRLILTTGTGSIFGFLVARQAYDAAIMAPMFILMSFLYGLAIFILVLMASYAWTRRPLGDVVLYRLRNLLAVFISAVLYFVLAYHLTNLYITENHGVEAFILLGRNGGSVYSQVFWIGQIILGSVIPLIIIFHGGLNKSRKLIAVASGLVVLGGLAQMYVTIVGAQAYPLQTFPGMEVLASGFYDGVAWQYKPTLPEFVLGLSGVAFALAAAMVAIRVLRFLPTSLADESVDPHYVAPDEAEAVPQEAGA